MRNHFHTIRITALVLVAALGGMLVAKNYLDQRNINGLESSFSEIYEDRLLAESYIFQLSDLLYRKKILLLEEPALKTRSGNHRKIDLAVSGLLERYESTRLTTMEKFHYLRFKKEIEALGILTNSEDNSLKNRIAACDRGILYLRSLSMIQVTEGKQLNDSSRQFISGSAAAIQLEWAIYFITLIIIAALARKKFIFLEQPGGHLLN